MKLLIKAYNLLKIFNQSNASYTNSRELREATNKTTTKMAALNKFTKTLSIDEKAEIKEKFTEVSWWKRQKSE